MPVSRQKAEDPTEIGASPPLNGHTLQHALRRHRRHHEVCAVRRKNGTSFEINRERQRTELLNRKYFDNLRQQQALSGRIEEPRATKDQNGTAPFDGDTSVFDSTKIKLSPSKMDKALKENTRKSTEDVSMNGATAAPASLATLERHSNGVVASPENRNGSTGDFIIKKEPESGENTPTYLKSPSMTRGSTAGSKVPPSSLPFPLPSTGASNGRVGRNFPTPEAKRKCIGSSSSSSRTPPMCSSTFSGTDEMEDDDDLKLNPRVFLNTVIRTPPIKALEEGNDPPITPSPTSVGPPAGGRCPSNPPTNNSCTSNHSNPPSTPTAAGAGVGSTNGVNTNSNSSNMAEDLNEFYRVMEQVCEKEGRLFSTSGASTTQIDMYSTTSPPTMMTGNATHQQQQQQQHLISPPPYNTSSSSRLPPAMPPTAPPLSASGYFGSSGGGAQHLPPGATTLTSPPSAGISSPPFSTAHSLPCFNPSLRGQHASSSSLALQQQQTQPPPTHLTAPRQTPGPMPSSQVDMSLQFSDPSLLTQQRPSQPQLPHQATQQMQQQQQQQLQARKAQTHPEICVKQSHTQQQQQQMQLAQHLGQAGGVRSSRHITPLNIPITSHVYLNNHQTQQRLHTSSAGGSIPPHQQPLTPTTPLEHFSAFQTTQSSQISPTHGSNPLHHQPLPGPANYSYNSPEHAQHLYHHHQRQVMQSSAVTVSTNSWGGGHSGQAPRLAYKDNRMVHAQQQQQQAVIAGTHMASLVQPQRPVQAEASMGSYQLQLQKMGSHPSMVNPHQPHTLPLAYLPAYGSGPAVNSPFSRHPFPPNMFSK